MRDYLFYGNYDRLFRRLEKMSDKYTKKQALQTIAGEINNVSDKRSYYTGYIDGLIFARRIIEKLDDPELDKEAQELGIALKNGFNNGLKELKED